jgi:hypothetical protein
MAANLKSLIYPCQSLKKKINTVKFDQKLKWSMKIYPVLITD